MNTISHMTSIIIEHRTPEKEEGKGIVQSPTKSPWSVNCEDRVSIHSLINPSVTPPLSPVKFTTSVTIRTRHEGTGVAKKLDFDVDVTASVDKVCSHVIKSPTLAEKGVSPSPFVQNSETEPSHDILAQTCGTKSLLESSPEDVGIEAFETFIATQILAQKKIEEIKNVWESEPLVNKEMKGKRKRTSEHSEQTNKKVKVAAIKCLNCELNLKDNEQRPNAKGRGSLCITCCERLECLHHKIKEGTYDKKNYTKQRRKSHKTSHERDLEILQKLPPTFFSYKK